MGRFTLEGRAEVIAHRGFSAVAPENTLAALRAGIDVGADALEFDLQITGDGVPVLFHDDTLGRTTNGSGSIRSWSARELGELDAGSWFGADFRGEPVPTLSRALELLTDWHGHLYPELKGVSRPEEVDLVVDEVRTHGLLERTVFIAMEWALLDRVRAHEPAAAIGYIVKKAGQTEDAIGRAGGDPLALLDFERSIPVRDRAATARARALGIPMAAWTVDAPEDAQRLLDVGVRRITTNRVDRILAWRDGVG